MLRPVTAGSQTPRVERARVFSGRQIFVATIALVVFLWCWVFLGHSFYARNATVTQTGDTLVYQGYGVAMRAGQVPYRDFSVVYPPGGLPVFLAPAYAVSAGDTAGYQRWFARLMAGCGVLCLLFVLASRPPARAVGFVALSPLLIGSLLLSRFDLWPTALVAAALAALLRDRYTLGFGALGAAVVAKVFALVLVPVAIVWTLRRAGPRTLRRGLAGFAIVVAAALGPFVVLAPDGLWSTLRDQVARAIQIESLVGAALLTFGHPTEFDSLGAKSIAGHETAAFLTTVVELGVLIALWVAFARGEMLADRFVRYLAACVCAFIAFGKVLSPQYLIWLVPLVPLVRGRRGLVATALLGAAMIATQWYFPGHYGAVEDGSLAWLVLARDLVLVVVLAVLAAPTARTIRARVPRLT
jgi:hypothetical protein